MSEIEDYAQRTMNRVLRVHEMALDRKRFEEVLQLATAVCLRREPAVEAVDRHEMTQPQKRIVQELGTRGLSAALDGATGRVMLFMDYPEDYGDDFDALSEREKDIVAGIIEDKKERFITSDSPYRMPEFFSGPVDPEIQSAIEAFGAELLDEAYASLGTDVNARIEQFKNAETDEEQMTIMRWLDCRIREITRRGSDRYGGEGYFYHPIRLSPKVLGQYPHHTMAPTCLGISVLTTSFMLQTGAPVMHAGAMQTRQESAIDDIVSSAELLSYRGDIGMTPGVAARLQSSSGAMWEDAMRDSGFHALGYVRLKSGAWCGVDPNFKSTYAVKVPSHNELLDEAYEGLASLRDVAPGVERVVSMHSVAGVGIARDLLRNLTLDEVSDDECSAILTGDVEELQSAIREMVMRRLHEHQQRDGECFELSLMLSLLDSPIQHYGQRHYQALDAAFTTAWTEFFLWGEDAQDVLDRCQRDPEYRRRRIEDMKLLPYLTLLDLARVDADVLCSTPNGEYDTVLKIHDVVELGLPEYRVGAAVLSDFTRYCQQDMSPLFWTTYWPSRVPISEYQSSDNTPQHTDGRAYNLSTWLAGPLLRYWKQQNMV